MLSAAPLWMLDEPFTNLDPAGIERVLQIIAEHLDSRGAVIIAAHQPPAIPGHTARRLELG